MTKILMGKATALWLIQNTKFTFEQISQFCGLHLLQIETLAHEKVFLRAVDPIVMGQITRQEIDACEADPARVPQRMEKIEIKQKRTKSYVPLSKRRDIPCALLWFVRNYPQVPDAQLCNLLKTTKNTVKSIREGKHKDMKTLLPKDPVLLGMCSQTQIDQVLHHYEIDGKRYPASES